MKPFGPEDRARRRLARLQSFRKISDAFATSTALPGNAPVVDRKRLPQEAIRLVSDFLATLVWPMMPQLVYKGVRTAARDEDTPVEDADAQVLIAAKITTVSGVRREVEVPVVVRNGKLLEPSVMMVDGVPRIIAQSLVDELTRGGTFRQSVDPRGNIYGPPMDREAHERYLEQGDEFKVRDRVSRGMYTVASRKAQLDPESQNILQQLVDLGPWSQSSPGATIEPEQLQPLLQAGLVEQQGETVTITDAGRAALQGKTAQSGLSCQFCGEPIMSQAKKVQVGGGEFVWADEECAARAKSDPNYRPNVAPDLYGFGPTAQSYEPQQPCDCPAQPLHDVREHCEQCGAFGGCDCAAWDYENPDAVREGQAGDHYAKCADCGHTRLLHGDGGEGACEHVAWRASPCGCQKFIGLGDAQTRPASRGAQSAVDLGYTSTVMESLQAVDSAAANILYQLSRQGQGRTRSGSDGIQGLVDAGFATASPQPDDPEYLLVSITESGKRVAAGQENEQDIAAAARVWGRTASRRAETSCLNCGHAQEMHFTDGRCREWTQGHACGCDHFSPGSDSEARQPGEPSRWNEEHYPDRTSRRAQKYDPGARVKVDGKPARVVEQVHEPSESASWDGTYRVEWQSGETDVVPESKLSYDEERQTLRHVEAQVDESDDSRVGGTCSCSQPNCSHGGSGSRRGKSCLNDAEGQRGLCYDCESFDYQRPTKESQQDPTTEFDQGGGHRVCPRCKSTNVNTEWIDDNTSALTCLDCGTQVPTRVAQNATCEACGAPGAKPTTDIDGTVGEPNLCDDCDARYSPKPRQAHHITCTSCDTAFISGDPCPGCGSRGESDLSGYENTRPTMPTPMHGRKGQVLGKDQLPVCDDCDKPATRHVGGYWLCDEHAAQREQRASLPGIGLGARVLQAGRAGQVVDVQFDGTIGGQLALVAWHDGGEDYFTVEDFRSGVVVADTSDRQAQMGEQYRGYRIVEIRPDETEIVDENGLSVAVLRGANGPARARKEIDKLLGGREAAHDEDGQPAQHNEERRQDDFSAGDTVAFATSFRNRTRGGPSYLIDSGTSAEVVRDVFEDGTRFEVRLSDGQLAIVPRETLKSAGRKTAQADEQTKRRIRQMVMQDISEDREPTEARIFGDGETRGFSREDVEAVIDEMVGSGEIVSTVIDAQNTGSGFVPALKKAQVGEGEVLQIKRESDVPCDACGSTSFVPTASGLACASCSTPFATAEAPAAAAPAPVAPAAPAAVQQRAVVAQQDYPAWCAYCGEDAGASGRPDQVDLPSGRKVSLCSRHNRQSLDRYHDGGSAQFIQSVDKMPDSFWQKEGRRTASTPRVDQVLREVQGLKDDGYSDLDVMLSVFDKYGEIAEAVMQAAREKGVLDV